MRWQRWFWHFPSCRWLSFRWPGEQTWYSPSRRIVRAAPAAEKRTKKRHGFRCGSVRKQRHKKAAFARLRTNAKRSCVQILRGSFAARTTTKGAFENFPCIRIKIDLFMVPCSSAPEFWMEKVRRAAPQALVAWGAALSALCAKILRQNRRFLTSPRLSLFCFLLYKRAIL